ncbi:MAG TPA: hypothetical protein VID47_08590 [Actinomycetota bacterium]
MSKAARFTGVTGLAVLLLLAPACGSGGDAASAHVAQLLSAAVSNTKSSTARLDLRMSVNADGLPSPVQFRVTGAFDYAKRVGTVSVHLPVGVSGTMGRMDMRVIGTTVFIHAPGLVQSAKPWVEVDTASLGGTTASVNPADPGAFLDYLNGLSGGVTDLGPSTVGGVPAEKLHADIDLERIADRIGADGSDVDSLKEMGLTSLPMDVWIDHASRVRRMFVYATISHEGRTGTMIMDLRMTGFGLPVHVHAPPPSLVGHSGFTL